MVWFSTLPRRLQSSALPCLALRGRYDDFVSANGMSGAKEKGKVRQEGKEYLVQEVRPSVEVAFGVRDACDCDTQ